MIIKLLKAREVAERLGVSEGYIRRRTGSGEIPCVKLPGGPVRYDLSEILEIFRIKGLPPAKPEIIFPLGGKQWV